MKGKVPDSIRVEQEPNIMDLLTSAEATWPSVSSSVGGSYQRYHFSFFKKNKATKGKKNKGLLRDAWPCGPLIKQMNRGACPYLHSLTQTLVYNS